MEAESKEGMKEPFSEEKYVTTPDIEKEQLIPLLHEDVEEEVASKMSDVQPTEKEKEVERRNGHLCGDEEALEEERSKITHFHEQHIRQTAEEGAASLSEDNTPEQKLSTQLECVKMEESTTETVSLVGENVLGPRLEDPEAEDEPGLEHSACQAQEQTPSTKDTVTSDKAPAEAECWDEYLLPAAHEMQGGVMHSSLEFDNHLKISQQHDTQTGWHFPAGLGLAEEMYCPVWQFPAVSYYPPLESTVPFEGEN